MSYLKVPYLQPESSVLLDNTILDSLSLTEKCLVVGVTLELKLRGVVDVDN